MKPFWIETYNGNYITDFLESLGLIPSNISVKNYNFIYYTNGLEYTTSVILPNNLSPSWFLSENEFYNIYINPEKCRVVHFKRMDYDVLICRPSKWGNPFSHKENTLAQFKVSSRNEAISKYEDWITNGDGSYLLADLHELKGKILGCWCHPKKCHGDILVKLVNKL